MGSSRGCLPCGQPRTGSRATTAIEVLHTDGGVPRRRAHPDEIVALIAGRQRGLVSYPQMVAAGLSHRAIEHRVRRGMLHRVHFAEASPAAVDVMTPRRAASRRGIRRHACSDLSSRAVGRRYGLPLTSPVRTLLDLAPRLGSAELERAFNEAQVLRLMTPDLLRVALDLAGGRPGTAKLRSLLDEPGVTRSEAERRFKRLVSAAELPAPRWNTPLHGFTVDWPIEGLVAEVDGHRFHSTRAAFERDRRRDAVLQAKGIRVMRLTWRQLHEEPHAVMARLAQALTARA